MCCYVFLITRHSEKLERKKGSIQGTPNTNGHKVSHTSRTSTARLATFAVGALRSFDLMILDFVQHSGI